MQQPLDTQITELCRAARTASRGLAVSATADKNRLLEAIAAMMDARRADIVTANELDIEAGRASGLSGAMLDRLALTPVRIDSMIRGCREVAALPDPVGEIMRGWTLPNGLDMSKVRVPIGVIGIIYESRPNVTVDAAALCLKTGNAVVLRGGKEAFESNTILCNLMQEAATASGFDPAVVQLVPTTDRVAIQILCAQDKYIDLMIPRGGHGLIETVVAHARMPVIKHFHGVCHVYVHADADPDMAVSITVNSKCQRPGVCNAAETLLIDSSVAPVMLPRLAAALEEAGVELFGDTESSRILGRDLPQPSAWNMEYLDLKMAVRVVKDLEDAIAHIEEHGSHHSDTIITADQQTAGKFLHTVDSAAVYWNASTRFTDGSQFGFGAEIGISTDKIHARGPMALEELTSYKYIARGTGQVRC